MNRKIHNNEGKSILMALLLLLVAVVVSVVIVTAAVSSVMQIDDNRKSQQEYLTVSSAAELIRDCLQDVTYIHTEKVYTPRWGYGDTKTETTQSSTAKYFTEFVKQTSKAILDNTDPAVEIVIPDKELTVTTDDMDSVNAVAKVIATGDNTYELRIKLETKHTGDSQGYRMRMNLVITKGAPITSNSTVRENRIQYNVTTTETTVTWGKATISKGWGNEE